jgi:hypothetical protein
VQGEMPSLEQEEKSLDEEGTSTGEKRILDPILIANHFLREIFVKATKTTFLCFLLNLLKFIEKLSQFSDLQHFVTDTHTSFIRWILNRQPTEKCSFGFLFFQGNGNGRWGDIQPRALDSLAK